MTNAPQTLSALLEASAQRYGDRPAVIDGPRRTSYAELAAEVRTMARALMAAGIQAGDRVAVWLPNTAHWLIAALGAHSAGASLVPMNTRYTGFEAFDILERTGARVTLAVAAAWAERAQVTDGDVYMIIAPFFHTFGYKAGWVVALFRGAAILPQVTFDIERVVDQIERGA